LKRVAKNLSLLALALPLALQVGAARARQCVPAPSKAKAPAESGANAGPIEFQRFGSFMFGGSVDRSPNGETFHGDHGYVQYYIPTHSRDLPLVMWHGSGQSGKTWETTPDGRDGFDHIFPRRGWSVFIVDQPRRGRAGKTSAHEGSTNHNPSATESSLWANFRMGVWTPPGLPTFFPGVQFPKDPASIDQFLRQQTFNTGAELFPSAEQRDFEARTMADLLRRTGPAVLLSHSHSGQYGWATAMLVPNLVKAVVAYEPGEYAFPEGEKVADIPTKNELLAKFMAPQFVSKEAFKNLTKMPIMIVFGDNISTKPGNDYGIELWRMVRLRAQQFADTVKRYGGDVRIVDLPAIGICGNTHFPMSDLNNLDVSNQLSDFLHEKRLDDQTGGYLGPDAK